MKYTEAVAEISQELDIPKEVVLESYRSFWKFIREKIKELPLKEDLTEEEFNELRTNFNIPSIGKLSCTYERYQYIKNNYKNFKEILENGNDNKESKTNV